MTMMKWSLVIRDPPRMMPLSMVSARLHINGNQGEIDATNCTTSCGSRSG